MSKVKLDKPLVPKTLESLPTKDVLEWFVCVITYTKNTLLKRGIKKAENRTVVVASWMPVRLINFMNLCEENDIVTAVRKTLRSPQMLLTQTSLSEEHYDTVILQPKFKIASIIGPMCNIDFVFRLMRYLEQNSRGQPSRTILAGELVKKFNLNFSINFYSLFGVDPTKYVIDVIELSKSGDGDDEQKEKATETEIIISKINKEMIKI